MNKILIAEDDKFLSNAYRVKLEKEGFETKLVGSGYELLDALKVYFPDLIILDLVIVALGFLWPLVGRLGLGRLPGDIVVERENFSFHFPIATMIVVSVVLTVLINVILRLIGRL